MKFKNPFRKTPEPTPTEVQSALMEMDQVFLSLPGWAQKHLKNGGSTEEILHFASLPARERKIKLKNVKRFLKKEQKKLNKNS